MKGGLAAHQCSYAFQVLGAGHIQENPGRFVYLLGGSSMFQYVSIVGRMPTHGKTPPRSPEHVNVLYEKGGSYTSVQLCISGTGGRAHPGESRTVRIGSYVPGGSNMFQ